MKIALLGYGKMGKEIEVIAQSRNHEVLLTIDTNNYTDLQIDNLNTCDVAIEFSTPQTAIENIHKCFEASVPVVVGTTGWLDKFDEVKQKCTEGNHSLFFAPNFSIGVNIFFELNSRLAQLMNSQNGYELNIEEIHHTEKLDAPSGTAIHLANGIIENMDRKTNWAKERSENSEDIAIKSKRIENVPGTHTITYKSSVDTIEIQHTAHSRKGFATGAVLAAEWILGKSGIFGMPDLIKDLTK